MSSNSVPVYRHGRKFYVSADEFERIRADDRRHRRTVMQKSQNLPVSKSYPANPRSASASSRHPAHRSAPHPHDHRYGVLRTPHFSQTPIRNDMNRTEPIRPSRSTSTYYDHKNAPSLVPVRLRTSTLRSSSSDRILHLGRGQHPPSPTHSGYVSDDHEIKRSLSAELLQPVQSQPRLHQLPRRQHVLTRAHGHDASLSMPYPVKLSDPAHIPSNASKFTNHSARIPPSIADSSHVTAHTSRFDTDVDDSNHVYSVRASSERRADTYRAAELRRSSSNNSNDEYSVREATSGSFSDDNASSPSMFLQQRYTARNQHHRSDHVIEDDVDYEQYSRPWIRPTGHNPSNDGLTEKKRVRFADTEGLTLEIMSDADQRRLPFTDRVSARRVPVDDSLEFHEPWPPLRDSFHHTSVRAGGSKLATDV